MELRFENGVPSKKWIISIPAGHCVDGNIAVALASKEKASVKASYKNISDRPFGPKRRVVILKFNRACDGKAVLNVVQRKMNTLEQPTAIIEDE